MFSGYFLSLAHNWSRSSFERKWFRFLLAVLHCLCVQSDLNFLCDWFHLLTTAGFPAKWKYVVSFFVHFGFLDVNEEYAADAAISMGKCYRWTRNGARFDLWYYEDLAFVIWISWLYEFVHCFTWLRIWTLLVFLLMIAWFYFFLLVDWVWL